MTKLNLAHLSAEEKRALLAETLRERGQPKRAPASFAQRQLWFLEQLVPGNTAYDEAQALRLHGPLDVDAWRRSCSELIRRHESLRTVFDEEDGEPVQVVAARAEPELTVLDRPHLCGPEGDAGVQDLVWAEVARSFDLRRGPLFRIMLVRLAPDEHILLLTAHHIICDMWSTSVALKELCVFYEQITTGRQGGLPPLDIQYTDYALWQRNQFAGGALTAQAEYWRRTLRGASPILDLPTDRPRPAVLGTRGGARPVRVAAATAEALSELGRQQGATPFMTMLTAFLVLLHAYSGEEDIIVGVPVANRGRREVESLIGLFATMVPVRVDLSGDPGFRTLISRVRKAALGAFAHQELPFERLVEHVGAERDLSRSPIFQVSFEYQDITLPPFDGTGLRAEPLHVADRTAQFDLTLKVSVRPDGLHGHLVYNSELFDPATVDDLACRLESLAGALLAEPDRPIGELCRPDKAAGQGPVRYHWKSPERIDLQGFSTPEYVAPRNADEELLCRLFARVLGRDEAAAEVGIHANFFELGGHSLLATRLMSQIRATCAVELPVRVVFQAPTPALLAGQLRAASGDVRPPLLPTVRPEILPLSFAQQRLWFLAQLEGPSATYNMPAALRVRGGLSRDALCAALNDVMARHETLRTVFPESGGVPRQQILTPAEAVRDLPVTDVSEHRLHEAMVRAARHPFDLTAEPPLYAELLALGPRDHVVVVVVHHIAADGWSLAPLGRDLATAYAARCAGTEPEWTPQAIQYSDYVLWQRDVLGDPEDAHSRSAKQLAYWCDTLAGLPERIALPVDRPHPVEPTRDGDVLTFTVEDTLHGKLTRLAAETNSTLLTVIHAAVATLLYRMGAGPDIPLGVPVAGRTDQATENLVGLLVNTLVIRTDLSHRPTFRTLLAEVQERSLAAYEHQDIPFEHVVDMLSPTRVLAYAPICQTMLAWQNTPAADLTLPGLAVETLPLTTGTTRLDLLIALAERSSADGGAAGINGTVEYNTDIFDRETIAALTERLTRILETVADTPDIDVDQLDVLTGDEHSALDSWNDTAGPVAQATLSELFDEQVARTPDVTAIVSADPAQPGQPTYRGLAAEANKLARLLIARGVGPGDIVAVALPQSTRMVVSVLAIAKAGAVYLPIDPHYSREQIDYLVQDAVPALLVTSSEVSDRLPRHAVRHMYLDDPAVLAELAAARDGKVPPAATHDDPAYVIYTFGSTGRPEGVVVAHRGISSLVAGLGGGAGVGEGARMLQFASPGVDASVAEICMTLLSGATLVVAPAARLLPGEPLARTCTEHDVSHIVLVPSVLGVLDPASLPTVSTLITVGEACPPATAAAWSAGRRMINAYGRTETTVCATLSGPLSGDGIIPMGRPIVNTQAYVFDERMRPVPVGVPGELYVGGVGVALGYLRRPDLTEEWFVPHPSGAPGEKLFRTGDLVRRLRDGQLEYLGRLDTQVKVRGFWVKLREIESVLLAHSQVDQAVVTVHEDQAGDRRLIGYLVARPGAVPELGAVRAHLAERLPAYMVPSALVPIPSLPSTSNGNLDHSALPAPRLDPISGGVAPRTPLESGIADIVGDVLGVVDVSADDDFFERGGHSLLATQLAARISAGYGVRMPLRVIFDQPTVAGLAAWLTEHQSGPEHEPIPSADRSVGIPLSFAQEQLVHHYPYEIEHHGHNVLTAVALSGALDEAALRASLDAIAQKHEALRTHVVQEGEHWRQVVHPTGRWPLAVADLSELNDEARDKELQRLLTEQRCASFRMAGETLVRGALITLRRNDYVLVLVMHHLVTDNWSYGVLFRELSAQYSARVAGHEPDDADALPIQYGDYAAWQQNQRKSGSLRARTEYWLQQLEGLPGTPGFTVPEHQRQEPLSETAYGFTVPAAEGFALAELGRQEGATLFMVMMAAFQVLLAAYAEREDIAVSFPVAGRERPETEHLIGFFASYLFIRSEMSGELAFRDLVARVREETLNAYANQGVQLWRLGSMRDPNRDPFAIAFNLLNATVPLLEFPGLTRSFVDRQEIGHVFPEVITDMQTPIADVTLLMRSCEDGTLSGVWIYAPDAVDPVVMAAMVRRWPVLLTELVADPLRGLGVLRAFIRSDEGSLPPG